MTKTDVLYSMPMMASARKWPRPADAKPARRPVYVQPGTAPMLRLVAHRWAANASTATAATFRPRVLQFVP